MEDVNISKFRAQVVREGSTPASPGFVVSEGQNPVDPSGSSQNHLPVTIAAVATGLSITESQILSGGGTVGQYIRGDGSLADFPATTGGGSSVSYYLNGSVSQGTIGGVAYREVNRNPVFGAGTDITTSSNGFIASFITDAGDPNKLLIPAGNWNLETYFSANSGGGSPTFYVELYKYNGTTFTLIASSSGTPELIAFGTNINPYFTTLAVPETVLTVTDRLALRYYVNTSGRTITLHTENAHLCQIITTFTTGLTALNGLTSQVQFFAVGTSGTDFNIASATDTHTFNLPTASATNRGALSSADWTTFNNKTSNLGTVTSVALTMPAAFSVANSPITTSGTLAVTATGTTAQYIRGDGSLATFPSVGSGTVTNVSALTLGTSGTDLSSSVANPTTTPVITLNVPTASASNRGALSAADWSTFNGKENAITAGTTAQYFRGDKTFQTLNTAAVPELTNLYYTEARVNANTNVAANTAARHNAVTIGTANGLSLSTQVLSLGLASAGVTGALSGTDWSTFNGKQNALTNPVTGTGTTNYLPKFTGTSTIGNSIVQDVSTRIDVAGGLRLTPSSSVDIQAYTGSAYSNLFYDAASHNWQTSGGTAKMVLVANGNVLIGTTSDNGAKLQVSGAATFSGNGSFGGASANTEPLYVKTNTDNNLRVTNAAGTLQLAVVNDAISAHRPFMLGNGWLNFASTGAATFSNKVGVGGAAATYSITAYNASNGTTAAFGGTARGIRIDNDGTFSSGRSTIYGVDSSFYGSYQPLSIEASSLALQAVTGGNVGIGTASPVSLLNVYGSTHLQLQNATTGSTGADGTRITLSGNDLQIINRETADVILYTNDTERMRITSGGNLLIGTTTDVGAKLYVNGAIRTANPTGSTSNDWLLGRALVTGSLVTDRWIRIQIGNLYYDLQAVYIGSV